MDDLNEQQPAEQLASPERGRAYPLQRFQRGLGNQAVQRLFGEAGTQEHHSPPASGPGSRAEPLVHGRGAVQPVAGMRSDAYHTSPVNPENPVLVWTDGRRLFFAPAAAQVEGGRAAPTPEPSFAPPSGYVAEELHWDRRRGLPTGGGALVVTARKRGAPDLLVAISNTLEQRSWFHALGLKESATSHVTRQGSEFLMAYDARVPLELSGAVAEGPIHRVAFPQGFLRYRAPGGDHDLYVARGASPAAYVVERTTGDIKQTFPAGTIDAVVPEESGVVRLERSATLPGIAVPYTRTIDLRASPPSITTALGHASAEAGYAAARSRLQARGVSIQERGLRLSVAELEAIESALAAGGGRGQTTLVQFRALEGLSVRAPILEVSKFIGPANAWGLASRGSGTPTLDISEPFSEAATSRVATIRHEMTHVMMGAIDALNRERLTSQQRANLEGAMGYEARRARQQARAGRLRAQEYGAGDVVPPIGDIATWQENVGQDPELASIWVELLKRYTFIPDPEGTGEFRGVSLADESRYSGAGDVSAGHPAESVSEFAASFVASAKAFREQFEAAVLAAEAAGNARGGRGGSYVRRLYRHAWRIIDEKYVPLGANPF